jgi:AcrR family transcriptional regulator
VPGDPGRRFQVGECRVVAQVEQGRSALVQQFADPGRAAGDGQLEVGHSGAGRWAVRLAGHRVPQAQSGHQPGQVPVRVRQSDQVGDDVAQCRHVRGGPPLGQYPLCPGVQQDAGGDRVPLVVVAVQQPGRRPPQHRRGGPAPTTITSVSMTQNYTQFTFILDLLFLGMSGAEPAGLRERKKLRTRAAISDAAIALFLAHGFDQVGVTRVAAEAEVSKRTLFAYFPTKEDLVLHRFADHERELADVVRHRPPARRPLEALWEHTLGGLRRRDPITGVTGAAEPLAIRRMIIETPSLAARLLQYFARSEAALREALADTGTADPVEARVLAAAVTSVLRALAEDNARRLTRGESVDAVQQGAVAAAARAFTLLERGFAA